MFAVTIGVLTVPGAITLTRIWKRATSFASDLARPITPFLAAT